MKKTVKFISAILCLVMLFTGCGNTAVPDETSAKELSSNHVQNIIEKNFEQVVADCTAEVKKQIDAAALADTWNTVAASAGEYVSVYSVEYAAQEGFAIVNTVLEYENTGLTVSLTYDRNGKIRGLWFNTAMIKSDVADNDIFTETEITVGEYGLKGILAVPDGISDYPVAVLVQGSGASDYNETVGNNRPFMEIAHSLAEKGIATVRINKRFFQHPELAAESAETLTIYDEYMDDIYAAVNYAKENVSGNLFVIGHSQGAMSAPKIALDNDVKGVIMLAGTTRGLEDIIYDQNMAVIETMNVSDDERSALIRQVSASVEQVKNLKPGDKTAPMGLPASYWLSLKELDAENILRRTEIPVLVLQGTRDFQVYADRDFEYMKSLFEYKENMEFKSYEGLNHLFMPQSLPGVADVAEYAQENHIPDYVLEDIAGFILRNS